jgi:hypothetical protein
MDPVVPLCSLNDEGRAAQRERQARLAPDVASIARRGSKVVVEFAEDFDRAALDELVAVERECCPFFSFEYDEERRVLSVGIPGAEHELALDAIAALLAQPARA